MFHGYGWKGHVAGPVVPPEEYARYCRYLVARYGARPAVYLIYGDGTGLEPQVEAGGIEVHTWDDSAQPASITGRIPAAGSQDADWLDFQSCQTGHDGDHVPDRLTTMWMYQPVKAIMNGEPTYENSGRRGKATGWWQGNEAWSNVCAGGTLGVVYGAGSLWQWRIVPTSPATAPSSIRVRWGGGVEFGGGAGTSAWSGRSSGVCRWPRRSPAGTCCSGPAG